MNTVILTISIFNLIFLVISFRKINLKITNIKISVDEIKNQTDKLGTYNYK